ncbi:MAG: MBL fold metallo-hydrolase [Kofleriaceae bacterium]|nr:MAG: MBL fold metallo-hydrolase [Kofleriaceae bacterium]
MLRVSCLLVLVACASPKETAAPQPSPAPPAPRTPLALTYLGVAGWQLDVGELTVLVDPYFSRPADFERPIVPDEAAIAARAPAKANLIAIGHSHVDHLLDAPAIAKRTGAQLLGSLSTTRIGRASGVPDDQLITIQGGEDFAFDEAGGYSVRVIPSLHSAIGDKHDALDGEVPPDVALPTNFAGYPMGGAYAYLVRAGGHEVFFLSTANFIEREVEGLRPDVAVIATGLRQHIHDYTCRLMRALGNPPLVYANHFDDWRVPAPTTPPPVSDDLNAFIAEVGRCSPGTRVVIPSHFQKMQVPQGGSSQPR